MIADEECLPSGPTDEFTIGRAWAIVRGTDLSRLFTDCAIRGITEEDQNIRAVCGWGADGECGLAVADEGTGGLAGGLSFGQAGVVAKVLDFDGEGADKGGEYGED